jgi:putative colanic acid biosynthesis UDP-glucose lipid carrier transferase
MLLVALCIFLEDRGPVFFLQRRTGLDGRPFNVYKFRSMTVSHGEAGVRQAKKNDVRITKIGRVLRVFSVDELPQLLNVLSGEMSLVGPRPHALPHDAAWRELVPAYDRRFETRPGLTGYAQICGLRGEIKTVGDIHRRVEADLQYIDGWSLSLDIKIALRTVPLLFSDSNAY